jgi:NAD(P)H-hydrate epimerase
MTAMSNLSPQLSSFVQKLHIPSPESHKGQNGKLLIVGGSELFHAASRWSLDVASCFVDMVFYSSVEGNNELIREAKGNFWNGIVIPREEIASYIDEADCVLIGPGMTRSEDTTKITEHLVRAYPQKRWVIDAGALQMISPHLLNSQMIITPHPRELAMLLSKINGTSVEVLLDEVNAASNDQLQSWSTQLHGVTIVLKGVVDRVITPTMTYEVTGGNPGMTKGGTGDVLAGLIAALACTNDLLISAVVGSIANKAAGEKLAEKDGPFFNASMLITAIPESLWTLYTTAQTSATE